MARLPDRRLWMPLLAEAKEPRERVSLKWIRFSDRAACERAMIDDNGIKKHAAQVEGLDTLPHP